MTTSPVRNREQLGTMLAALRQAQGTTQAEVADAAGLHPSTVSRLETAAGPPPRLASLVATLGALGHTDPAGEAARWEHVCAGVARELNDLCRRLGRRIHPHDLGAARRELEAKVEAEADAILARMRRRLEHHVAERNRTFDSVLTRGRARASRHGGRR